MPSTNVVLFDIADPNFDIIESLADLYIWQKGRLDCDVGDRITLYNFSFMLNDVIDWIINNSGEIRVPYRHNESWNRQMEIAQVLIKTWLLAEFIIERATSKGPIYGIRLK